MSNIKEDFEGVLKIWIFVIIVGLTKGNIWLMALGWTIGWMLAEIIWLLIERFIK